MNRGVAPRLLLLCLGCLVLTACAPQPVSHAVPQYGRTEQAQAMEEMRRPRRVVSLYPTASEILSALGAAQALAGCTLHDSALPGLENVPVVGGFAAPSLERILACKPDLVLATPFHSVLIGQLTDAGVSVLVMDTLHLADAAAAIRQLGTILGCEEEAQALIAAQQAAVQRVKARVAGLEPPRAIRFMGFTADTMLVPGDDSFQNDYIALAGGRTADFGRDGAVIGISAAEWRDFAPQFVYWCGPQGDDARRLLEQDEWNGVPALRQGRITSFPCDLTCRAGVHYGEFAEWLAAELHGEALLADGRLGDDRVLSTTPLEIPFDYVAEARIHTGRFLGAVSKTLLLRFAQPMTVLSTLTGWATGIHAVGNQYSAPPSWPLTHALGFEASNQRLLDMLTLQPGTSVMLHTGADMDNLAVSVQESDGLAVVAIATAGVGGNAMRAGRDAGLYVEPAHEPERPGTVNIVVLTNRTLSPAAMSRGVVTVTEAKTAALEDLDIRSSYTGGPATGTGTDNVVLVSGSGPLADLTGGHTKLGELMARAAYDAVNRAIARQNHLHAGRDIFQRLAERGIVLGAYFSPSETARLEQLLLIPRYAEFMSAALTLADAHERGLLPDNGAFVSWCRSICTEIAGKDVVFPVQEQAPHSELSLYLRYALEALLGGVQAGCQGLR